MVVLGVLLIEFITFFLVGTRYVQKVMNIVNINMTAQSLDLKNKVDVTFQDAIYPKLSFIIFIIPAYFGTAKKSTLTVNSFENLKLIVYCKTSRWTV